MRTIFQSASAYFECRPFYVLNRNQDRFYEFDALSNSCAYLLAMEVGELSDTMRTDRFLKLCAVKKTSRHVGTR